MNRRTFLESGPIALWGLSAPVAGRLDQRTREASAVDGQTRTKKSENFLKSRDFRKEPFKRLVILGESMVSGGAGRWLQNNEQRYADVVAQLISTCQEKPVEYLNKGIGGNAISQRSPGYPQSTKPSALERYKTDVIDLNPDLFILAYGTNDMVAGMPVADFREDMARIISDVKKACAPMIVLTTIYYMTGWKSWPPFDKGSVELSLAYNDCIRGLANEFDCVVADVWAAAGGADWLIHYDGAHSNRVGCLVIGHRVFEAICQHASGLTQQTFSQIQRTDWSQMAIRKRREFGDPFQQTW
jgi:lysophospholipase L1-like esterase